MLEVRNIQTYYGNIQALKNVSLTINEGEIVTLIGANGAGKSTTLMSICGVTPPRHGEILFHGQPIQHLSAEAIVRLGICQVPEGRHIFPQMSVLENLEMGAFLRSDKKGIAQDLDHVLALFPILAGEFFGLAHYGKIRGFLGIARGAGSVLFNTGLAGPVQDSITSGNTSYVCVPDHVGECTKMCLGDECFRIPFLVTFGGCVLCIFLSVYLFLRRRHQKSVLKPDFGPEVAPTGGNAQEGSAESEIEVRYVLLDGRPEEMENFDPEDLQPLHSRSDAQYVKLQ